MAGRRIINEADARRCLAAVGASRSGLSDWARAHGIDGRSLNLWRVNLSRRGQARRAAPVPRMVELVPVGAPPSASLYVLRVDGVELEVGHSFDEASLVRLVRVLKSC